MNRLDYYESTETKGIKILADEESFFKYKSNTSLHSFVTRPAYGYVLERDCLELSSGTEVCGEVYLDDIDKRFFLKIIACLPKWENCVCPLSLKINGQLIYDNNEAFFEQVCLGWPALYVKVPDGVLTTGKNIITVKADGGLYLSELSFVTYPKIQEFEQVSIKKHVRKGDRFAVAVKDSKLKFKQIKNNVNCEFLGSSYYKDLLILSFTAGNEGDMECLAEFFDVTVNLDMPKVVSNEDRFIVGSDSDDHRQDDSDETSFIIETLVLSDMGEFIQIRPKFSRTYYKLLSKEGFKELVDFMTKFGVKYGVSDDYDAFVRYLPDINPEMFFGFHIHEPYLFLNDVLTDKHIMKNGFIEETKRIEKAQSFGESKQIFLDVLKKSIKNFSKPVGQTSFGCPSLLLVHEAEAGIDRMTIEPAACINLLTGAARAVDVKSWGAHLPPDWYFGTPVDIVKANKYRLAMQYLYLNGASYVYAENSLFKTNAFERCDWESEYCKIMRQYQRDFNDYTLTHQRKGKLVVDKAIVYGRNEFIMWKMNDRVAELKEPKDWDSNVWYKWDNTHQVAWNASEAWLPPSDNQYVCENISNKKLFAGTPYGNVDIVSVEKDLSKYNTLVFLGWNTMGDDLIEKLKDYVYNGGTLMISYAHFNYTDRNDQEMTFPESSNIKEFIGIDINESATIGRTVDFDGKEFKFESNLRIVTGESCGAKAICFDDNGNGVIYKNQYGKGRVYFLAFKDYIKEEKEITILSHLMKLIGNEGDSFCDNHNVSFTVREDGDKYYISVLNMNCFSSDVQEFNIDFMGRKISGKIKVGEILDFVIEK